MLKKILSIALALVLAVGAFAAFALTADSSTNNPFRITSIKVSDASGYSNPYAAVDSAKVFSENEAAYVVMEYNLIANDGDGTYKGWADFCGSAADPYVTTVTSSTLDFTYAEATRKVQTKYFDGSISATYAMGSGFTGSGVYNNFSYDSTKYEINVKMDPSSIAGTGGSGSTYYALFGRGKVEKYFVAFIAVTKSASAGEIKAAMKVASTKFTTSSDFWLGGSTQYLVAYDAAGSARYTIVKLGGSQYTYRVFSGKAVKTNDPHVYLFDYVQNGTMFRYIGYSSTPGSLADDAVPVGFTYDGRLVFLGGDNTLGTSDDKDLTSVVNEANAFFGFTFSTSNPAADKDFQNKTAGNPYVVTDTYSYFTAPVAVVDEEVEIAPTGDLSANIVIVLAASAVLAVAALAFVAKRSRE